MVQDQSLVMKASSVLGLVLLCSTTLAVNEWGPPAVSGVPSAEHTQGRQSLDAAGESAVHWQNLLQAAQHVAVPAQGHDLSQGHIPTVFRPIHEPQFELCMFIFPILESS